MPECFRNVLRSSAQTKERLPYLENSENALRFTTKSNEVIALKVGQDVKPEKIGGTHWTDMKTENFL